MKNHKYLNNFFCSQHRQEKLNLVCIEKQCRNKGLICQLCRDDEQESSLHPHPDKIVPFKLFIDSIEKNINHKQLDYSREEENKSILKLEEYRDDMLYRLKLIVEEIAESVQTFQSKIIDDYEANADIIRNKFLIFKSYHHLIERVVMHDIKKQEKFQIIAQVRSIIDHVSVEEHRNHYKYCLETNCKRIMAEYLEKKEKLKLKCELIETKIQNILSFDTIKDQQKSNYKKQRIQLNENNILNQSQSKIISQIKEQSINEKERKRKEEREKRKIEKEKMKYQLKQQKQLKLNQLQSKLLLLADYDSKSNSNSDLIDNINKVIPSPFKSMISSFVPSKTEKQFEQPSELQNKPSLFQNSQNAKLKEKLLKFQELQDSQSIKNQPIFSSLYKGMTIKISKNGKIAKQTASNKPSYGFTLISEQLQKRNKITYRIAKLKTQIYLGIALQPIITSNKYTFSPESKDHGAFLINSKGFCFSSNTEEWDSIKYVNFTFQQGDIINLSYKNNELQLESSSIKKQNKNQQLGVIKSELKTACFCVLLQGSGDTIQIL